MAKNKKFRLYTHHRSFLSLSKGNKNPALKFILRLLGVFYDFLYFLGSAIINFLLFLKKTLILLGKKSLAAFQNLGLSLKNDLKKTKTLLPKRLTIFLQKQYAKTLLLFIALGIISWFGIASMHLVARGLELKSSVLQTAMLGNSYLAKAQGDLSDHDLQSAQSSFARAYQTFTQGQQEITQSGADLNGLLSLLPQKQDADGLLSAAALVSSAGQDLIALETGAKSLQLSPAGINSQGQSVPQVLQGIGDSLTSALGKITQASQLLTAVNPNTLPQANRETFVTLEGQMQNVQLALTNLNSVFGLAQTLLSGQKTVLVMFENNNELRAGGGFMGTYGALSMNNGAIGKMTVSSIYDLDGQLTNVIQPPQPILNLIDRWYLRDSNWFADFPTSAREISSFYEMEGGETPDVIIALTPNLIIDLLKITGPITLPNYGVTLTADNFVEQTQYITTLSDNLPTNQPKQLLADLVPLLLQKLAASGSSVWPQVIQSLQDELNNKQIVAYSRDSSLENQFENFNWGGQLTDTDRDYLSVVSSNLGGTKTDLEINQKINLTTTVNPDGSITNEVDLTRTNTLPNLADTENDSYIRVYVPLGSQLVSAIGFDYKNLQYPANETYQTDPEVYNWEKNSVTDNLTGTTIGIETGKTFFGNWLDIKGGESKTVKLVYTLPFKLADIDRYSLLAQKQIGATNSDFNWTLNFDNRQLAWKNFDTNNLNTDNLNTDIMLDKDYFFGLVLQKR